MVNKKEESRTWITRKSIWNFRFYCNKVFPNFTMWWNKIMYSLQCYKYMASYHPSWTSKGSIVTRIFPKTFVHSFRSIYTVSGAKLKINLFALDQFKLKPQLNCIRLVMQFIGLENCNKKDQKGRTCHSIVCTIFV